MSDARAAILGAIHAAAVPPAPTAVPVPSAQRASLAEFAAAVAAVGGQVRLCEGHESLHDVVAALAGNGIVATMIRGRFGVAENGAVYVDAADLGRRTDVVSAEHLVVVMALDAIVPTMHEAVRLIPAGSGCGWFLSGPSKTADIEQALVIGAQGARTLTVVLTPA
jgi:L-lactate dehydrogenase complex protein LldG